MKTINQIKVDRLMRRSNDWILDTLCYPVIYLQRKIKRLNNKNKDIYNWSTPMRFN